MRNLTISDQSWTVSEVPEAQQGEAAEELSVTADTELERSFSFTYGKV